MNVAGGKEKSPTPLINASSLSKGSGCRVLALVRNVIGNQSRT